MKDFDSWRDAVPANGPVAAPVIAQRDPRQWAHDLAKRERMGERLTLAQRTMWRAAIARPTTLEEQP